MIQKSNNNRLINLLQGSVTIMKFNTNTIATIFLLFTVLPSSAVVITTTETDYVYNPDSGYTHYISSSINTFTDYGGQTSSTVTLGGAGLRPFGYIDVNTSCPSDLPCKVAAIGSFDMTYRLNVAAKDQGLVNDYYSGITTPWEFLNLDYLLYGTLGGSPNPTGFYRGIFSVNTKVIATLEAGRAQEISGTHQVGFNPLQGLGLRIRLQGNASTSPAHWQDQFSDRWGSASVLVDPLAYLSNDISSMFNITQTDFDDAQVSVSNGANQVSEPSTVYILLAGLFAFVARMRKLKIS
jgi:hypothetical protein